MDSIELGTWPLVPAQLLRRDWQQYLAFCAGCECSRDPASQILIDTRIQHPASSQQSERCHCNTVTAALHISIFVLGANLLMLPCHEYQQPAPSYKQQTAQSV